jgi:hypothetical protein
MDESLIEGARRRANYACEYCRMPQAFYPTVPFPIDHVIARQHGGPTALNNLAFSCLPRNSHKGPNIAGIDPKSKKLTKLFNPRRHKGARHFRWDRAYLIGRTAVGRVTVVVLALNDPEAVEVRAALLEEGTFPPSE